MQLTFVTRQDKINKDGSAPIRAIITFNGVRVRKNIGKKKEYVLTLKGKFITTILNTTKS